MALSHEKQVRPTTTGPDKPLKPSVQVGGSKSGKNLRELFDGAEATLPSSADRIEIQQVSCDSRRVVKGALFFALHGAKADGNAFIEDAVKRGAVAIASEKPAPKGFPRGVTWVRVPEPRKALATTAANFFGDPARLLTTRRFVTIQRRIRLPNLWSCKGFLRRFGMPEESSRCSRPVRIRWRWTDCGAAIFKRRCSRI